MKRFIYKTIITVVAIVLVYEFTIAKHIKKFTSKSDMILSKEGRKDTVDKLRDEIKKAIKKDRYLSKEDAILIKKFLNKIKNELENSEN